MQRLTSGAKPKPQSNEPGKDRRLLEGRGFLLQCSALPSNNNKSRSDYIKDVGIDSAFAGTG